VLKRAMGGRVGSFEWMDGVGRAEWVGGRWRAGGEERQGCARTQSSSRQCYTSWLKCDLWGGGGGGGGGVGRIGGGAFVHPPPGWLDWMLS